jgi:hypothetical protein
VKARAIANERESNDQELSIQGKYGCSGRRGGDGEHEGGGRPTPTTPLGDWPPFEGEGVIFRGVHDHCKGYPDKAENS